DSSARRGPNRIAQDVVEAPAGPGWTRAASLAAVLLLPALIAAAAFAVHRWHRDAAHSLWLPAVAVTVVLSTFFLAAAAAMWLQSATTGHVVARRRRRAWTVFVAGTIVAMLPVLSADRLSRADRLLRYG